MKLPYRVKDKNTQKNFDHISSHLTQPAARVYSSIAHPAVANGAVVAQAFNQEDFDQNGLHDNAVNNTRLTASSSGIYVAVGAVALNAIPAGRVILLISLNGGANARGAIEPPGADGQAVAMVRLNKGDFVEFNVWNLSGGAVTPAAGSNLTWFAMSKVSSL